MPVSSPPSKLNSDSYSFVDGSSDENKELLLIEVVMIPTWKFLAAVAADGSTNASADCLLVNAAASKAGRRGKRALFLTAMIR